MTEQAQATQARDTLLLSHANPEDNEFTLWLALQLANEGSFPVSEKLPYTYFFEGLVRHYLTI
jgi:hypothetical protein